MVVSIDAAAAAGAAIEALTRKLADDDFELAVVNETGRPVVRPGADDAAPADSPHGDGVVVQAVLTPAARCGPSARVGERRGGRRPRRTREHRDAAVARDDDPRRGPHAPIGRVDRQRPARRQPRRLLRTAGRRTGPGAEHARRVARRRPECRDRDDRRPERRARPRRTRDPDRAARPPPPRPVHLGAAVLQRARVQPDAPARTDPHGPRQAVHPGRATRWRSCSWCC